MYIVELFPIIIVAWYNNFISYIILYSICSDLYGIDIVFPLAPSLNMCLNGKTLCRIACGGCPDHGGVVSVGTSMLWPTQAWSPSQGPTWTWAGPATWSPSVTPYMPPGDLAHTYIHTYTHTHTHRYTQTNLIQSKLLKCSFYTLHFGLDSQDLHTWE